MKITLLGDESELSRATASEVSHRGHELSEASADCVILFPGGIESFRKLAGEVQPARLVLRSHAAAYGALPKNPGYMTEDRLSLLPDDAPERKWLQAEQFCEQHAGGKGWAAVRLAPVLTSETSPLTDEVVRSLRTRSAATIAGRDPNVQFISLQDAAKVMVDAAESEASGIFNAAGNGSVPLKKAYRAAGVRRLPAPKWVVRKLHAQESPERLEYNWTVSTTRAATELGWHPEKSSAEALEEFVRTQGGGSPELLSQALDP